MFTADNRILAWGKEYAVIVLSFSVVVTVQIAFEKIYQSTGNMFVPMVCMAAGSITNIILDPVFIFGLGPVSPPGGKRRRNRNGYRAGGYPSAVSDMVL